MYFLHFFKVIFTFLHKLCTGFLFYYLFFVYWGRKTYLYSITVNRLTFTILELGIDVNFLDNMEEEIRMSEERNELQQRLDSMCQLLEKLQQTQYQRLSAPLPQQLNNCPPPSEEEAQIAENITDNLTDITRRVNPGDVAPVPSIRKALGLPMPEVNPSEVSNIDLESELRQFLESEPSLAQSPLRDDKTIEEILME